jgi:hypothetical protein
MDEAIRKTFSLKEVIPGIVDIQQGYNFSKRSKGYELGITIRFEDRACLENYGPHPAQSGDLRLFKGEWVGRSDCSRF